MNSVNSSDDEISDQCVNDSIDEEDREVRREYMSVMSSCEEVTEDSSKEDLIQSVDSSIIQELSDEDKIDEGEVIENLPRRRVRHKAETSRSIVNTQTTNITLMDSLNAERRRKCVVKVYIAVFFCLMYFAAYYCHLCIRDVFDVNVNDLRSSIDVERDSSQVVLQSKIDNSTSII